MSWLSLLAFASACLGLQSGQTPSSGIPSGWQRVKVCQISFLAPKDLTDQRINGVDSCVAEYRSNTMRLHVDSGMSGAAATKTDMTLEFKETSIEIDGIKAQLVTYQDSRNLSKLNLIAQLFLVLYRALDPRQGSSFLTVMIEARGAKEMEMAKQILGSIHLEARPLQ